MSDNNEGFILLKKQGKDETIYLEAWRTDELGKPRELWASVAFYANDEDEEAAILAAAGEQYFVSPTADYKQREGFDFICRFFDVENPRTKGGAL